MEQQIKIIREALELIEAIVKQPVNSGNEWLIKEIEEVCSSYYPTDEIHDTHTMFHLLLKCTIALSQVKPSVTEVSVLQAKYNKLFELCVGYVTALNCESPYNNHYERDEDIFKEFRELAMETREWTEEENERYDKATEIEEQRNRDEAIKQIEQALTTNGTKYE